MRIENKEEAIFALGEFLYELGLGWEWLPTVYPGTTYGENTREAVKEIQRRFDLPVTGVVDLDTWRLIYDAYRKKRDQRERFPSPAAEKDAFPLTVGQRGYEVLLLRGALGALSEFYPSLPRVLPGSLYQTGTANAVRGLQHIYRLEETGEVDVAFWNRMFLDLASKMRIQSQREKNQEKGQRFFL